MYELVKLSRAFKLAVSGKVLRRIQGLKRPDVAMKQLSKGLPGGGKDTALGVDLVDQASAPGESGMLGKKKLRMTMQQNKPLAQLGAVTRKNLAPGALKQL